MRPLLAALAVVAVALVGAPPAAAEPVLVDRFTLAPGEYVQDLALAGDATLLVRHVAFGASTVRAARPGAPPATVARFGADQTFELRASATRLAVLEHDGDRSCPKGACGPGGDEVVRAGPPAGPLAEVERCAARRDDAWLADVALDGDLLAVHGACDRASVRLHDLSGATAPPRVPVDPADLTKVAVAGDRLAVLGNDEVIVHRVADGRPELALPVRGDAVALQPDGTVAVASGDDLVSASPAAPSARRVALPPTARRLVGLGGRRAVLAGEQLVAAGLDGGVDVLARTATGTGIAAAAVAGTTVAWATVRCGVVTVLRDDTALTRPAPAAPAPPPTGCGLPKVLGGGLAPRAPELRVRLRCAVGCRGTLRAFAPASPIPAGAGDVRIAFAPDRAARTVRIPVAPAFARRARRRGARVVVTLTAEGAPAFTVADRATIRIRPA